MTEKEIMDPYLDRFASLFYPPEDSPSWVSEKEELRHDVLAVALEYQNPLLYQAFIQFYLLPSVKVQQSPADLRKVWKAFFDKQGPHPS